METRDIRRWWARDYGPILLLLLVAAAVLVFGEIAEDVQEGSVRYFDLQAFLLLRHYRSPFVDGVAVVLSALLLWPPVLFLVGSSTAWLWFRGLRRQAVVLFCYSIGSSIVNYGLKYLFHRHRPLPSEMLIPATGLSFPSGHSSFAVVFYGLVGYLIWKYAARRGWARALVIVVTILLILATGLARVLLGVHFATDVLAGWVYGGAVLAAAIFQLEVTGRRTAAG